MNRQLKDLKIYFIKSVEFYLLRLLFLLKLQDIAATTIEENSSLKFV